MIKKIIICIGWLLSCFMTVSHAQPYNIGSQNGFGQTIQIQTNLNAWLGTPMWMLEIRDLDHNQTIPYMFDITRGNNFWIPLTFGQNYLILASSVQIASYRSCTNDYCNYRIRNFCNLESNGRIQRGESMMINITGVLSPNRNTYHCQITKFKEPNFTVYQPCCT